MNDALVGLAHQGALGAVAVAAAAEERDHTAGGQGARHLNDVAQGVVGVRVVDHDQKGLAAVHALEAAGDRGACFDAARDGGEIQAVTQAHPRRRQNVRHIDVTDQRRFDGLMQILVDQVEAQTIETGADVFRAQAGFPRKAVPDHAAARGRQHVLARRVVGIEDHPGRGRGGVAGRKKRPLGGGVGFHSLVEVEMVAGEVGKNGGMEMDSENARQRQGMRGYLHRQVPPAELVKLGRQADYIERFGRRIGRLARLGAETVLDGTDHRGEGAG